MEPTRASEGEHAQPAAATEGVVASPAGPVAQLLGLQRTIGNRRTAAFVARTGSSRLLQRYKVRGPAGFGAPVHETLTLLAVKQAKQQLEAEGSDPGELLADFDTDAVPDRGLPAGFDPENAPASHQQFIRGVVWADDPSGLFFATAEGTVYSTLKGVQWAAQFGAGQAGDTTTLTARSHFGDLQFLHGMASADAEAAEVTKANVLEWAHFLVDVASGQIDAAELVADIAEVSDWFPDAGAQTISQLFGWADAPEVDIRRRAVGALFHLIQDSFAHGHVQRNAKREIVEFHAFGAQDEHAHERYDVLGGEVSETLGERLKQTRGAETAIEHCATTLAMIAGGMSTDEVVSYLDSTVFPLAAGARPAGAGEGFEKPAEPAEN